MSQQNPIVFIDEEKRNVFTASFEKAHSDGTVSSVIDKSAERAYGTISLDCVNP